MSAVHFALILESIALLAIGLNGLLASAEQRDTGRRSRSSGRSVGLAFMCGIAWGSIAVAFFYRLSQP